MIYIAIDEMRMEWGVPRDAAESGCRPGAVDRADGADRPADDGDEIMEEERLERIHRQAREES
jgi:hypothetical protein